jgi:hypothetical protein
LLLPLLHFFVVDFAPLPKLILDLFELQILFKDRVVSDLVLEIFSKLIFLLHCGFHLHAKLFDFGPFPCDHLGAFVYLAMGLTFFLEDRHPLFVGLTILSNALVHR